jgi:membrane-bound lytic murein transglycosylase D
MQKPRRIPDLFDIRINAGVTILFFFIFCLAYLLLKVFVYPPWSNKFTYSDNTRNVLGPFLPSGLNFCGERIPTNNFDIRKELNREFFGNEYWKSNYHVLFEKARRWFPYIEPVLKQEGVPEDFKYMAVIESHLSNAVSPAGAAGFWQLVPLAANRYGLEVNAQIDERFHVEKATRAAAKHIKEAFEVFGNWTLAAAAYNRGIAGIQAAMEKQKARSYYQLMLNRQTASFVYRILAYKTLLNDPGHFGIKEKRKSPLPRIAFKTIKLDSSVRNLRRFIRHAGTDVKTIRRFNPWFVGDHLVNPAHKTYYFNVPKNKKGDYSAYIRDLKPYQDIGIDEPEDSPLGQVNEDSLQLVRTVQYVVRIDEPLGNLAAFFKVKEEDLRKWNNLLPEQHAVKGQTLVINIYR